MKNFVASALVLGLSLPAFAATPEEIESFLNRFQQNPQETMWTLPKKVSSGSATRRTRSLFSSSNIDSGAFIEAKSRARNEFCNTHNGVRTCVKDQLGGRSAWEDDDLAESIVSGGQVQVNNLVAMEKKKLKSARLKETPWSDSYWPLYQGQLGARYVESAFQDTSSRFKTLREMVLKLPFVELFNRNDEEAANNLSPSEKYDLLIGDMKGTLTEQAWASGEGYMDSRGKVETWMGLCHGWAAASMAVPRPKNAITLLTPQNRSKLKFFPSDIKALNTLLWAEGMPNTPYAGARCNEKKPKTDPKSGRIIDTACNDTNPGTFHLTVVNQIGLQKRSLVMDATFDYEVWNHPIYSYSYRYFNPVTKTAVSTLAEATVRLSDFKDDPFAEYRSKKSKYVVGISMDVGYVVEEMPTHDLTDSMENDPTEEAHYMYDLELSESGEIVGGEWYQNTHPDFLWTVYPGDRATSDAESFATGTWYPNKGIVPAAWRRAAQTAAKTGTPLAKIVERMTTESHRPGSTNPAPRENN